MNLIMNLIMSLINNFDNDESSDYFLKDKMVFYIGHKSFIILLKHHFIF